MKSYKSFAIVSIYCIGTALAIIISIVFFIKVNVAQAATLPETQEISAMTAIEQYGYGEGLSDYEVATFKRIALCENDTLDPYRKNPTSSATGIFQFINSTWRAHGKGNIYSVRDNVRSAISLYQKAGFTQWSCY